MTVRNRLDDYGGFIDVGILHHGLAPHMRDYDVIFEALWGKKEWADAKGTYRLRFTHCVEATLQTAVSDDAWTQSWSDVFTDYEEWIEAGEPEGFVWGACWSTAYPGLTYVDDSDRAREWTVRLGREMHEVTVETEAFKLRLVFHDFSVTKLNDDVEVVDKVIFPFNRNPVDDPG